MGMEFILSNRTKNWTYLPRIRHSNHCNFGVPYCYCKMEWISRSHLTDVKLINAILVDAYLSVSFSVIKRENII